MVINLPIAPSSSHPVDILFNKPSHRNKSSDLAESVTNCSPHLSVSVASLQQHVQGILQTTPQVRSAAPAEQRAQLEGGGGSLFIDVRQQIFVLLCAQDKLGVVVVEVHLLEDAEKGFVILEQT